MSQHGQNFFGREHKYSPCPVKTFFCFLFLERAVTIISFSFFSRKNRFGNYLPCLNTKLDEKTAVLAIELSSGNISLGQKVPFKSFLGKY